MQSTSPKHSEQKLQTRIGCVPYLNALPLIQGLQASIASNLLLASPAQLDQAMLNGNLDLALLPVTAYLENPNLKLIPGTGIVSRGAVLSVKAFHAEKNINLINTEKIYLDPHSKTSQRLLKILLVKKYKRDLDEIQWVNKPEGAETVLLIGDKALQNKTSPYAQDLGQEWQDLTGLPFVYACWMSPLQLNSNLLSEIYNAKMQGKQNLESIAQCQEVIAPAEALRYLSQHIHYDIAGPELVGLKMFFDWVQELEDQSYDTSLRFVA